ncbi:hypothetical protein DsansV1_C26g0194071 [Dioscorea sansibarensis]
MAMVMAVLTVVDLWWSSGWKKEYPGHCSLSLVKIRIYIISWLCDEYSFFFFLGKKFGM